MAVNGIDDQSIDFTAHLRRSYTDVTVRQGTTKLGATGEGENNNFHSRKRHKKTRKQEMQFNKGNDVMAE